MWEAAIAIALLGGAIAVVTFREWFPTHDNVINRELAMAPRTPIDRIRGGVVAISGRTRAAGASFIAPLSGRKCLAFQVTIYERMGYGWDVLGRFGDATPFWVDDDTGSALVDPGDCFWLTLVRDAVTLGESPSDMPSQSSEVIRRHALERGISLAGAGRDLRFQEGVLEEGDTVAAAGHAATEAHPRGESAGPRRLPLCLVLRGGGWKEPLLISDDPRANGR